MSLSSSLSPGAVCAGTKPFLGARCRLSARPNQDPWRRETGAGGLQDPGLSPGPAGREAGKDHRRLGLSDRASLDHGWAFARPRLLSWEEQAGGDPGLHTNKLWRQTTS